MERALILYVHSEEKFEVLSHYGECFEYEIFLTPDEEALEQILQQFPVAKCLIDANFIESQRTSKPDATQLFKHTDISFTKKIFNKFAKKHQNLANRLFLALTDNPDCIRKAKEDRIPVVHQFELPYQQFFEYIPEPKNDAARAYQH